MMFVNIIKNKFRVLGIRIYLIAFSVAIADKSVKHAVVIFKIINIFPDKFLNAVSVKIIQITGSAHETEKIVR